MGVPSIGCQGGVVVRCAVVMALVEGELCLCAINVPGCCGVVVVAICCCRVVVVVMLLLGCSGGYVAARL